MPEKNKPGRPDGSEDGFEMTPNHFNVLGQFEPGDIWNEDSVLAREVKNHGSLPTTTLRVLGQLVSAGILEKKGSSYTRPDEKPEE